MSDSVIDMGVSELLTHLGAQELELNYPCVYVMRDREGEALYVGSSKAPLRRVGAHAYDEVLRPAVSVALIRCRDDAEMARVEEWLITRFKPPGNVRGVSPLRPPLRPRAGRRSLRLQPTRRPVTRTVTPEESAQFRKTVGDELLRLLEDGLTEIGIRHLYQGAAAAGVSRAWLYLFMRELVAEGAARKLDRKPWVWAVDAEKMRQRLTAVGGRS